MQQKTDIRQEYAALLERSEWTERRKQILERDEYKCRHCNSTNALQVHHRQYHSCKKTGAIQAPWRYQDKLLITLCTPCHKRGHELYNIPKFTI